MKNKYNLVVNPRQLKEAIYSIINWDVKLVNTEKVLSHLLARQFRLDSSWWIPIDENYNNGIITISIQIDSNSPY